MKRIKILTAILAAVAVLAMIPDASALKVRAEESKTYAVKYSESNNRWYYQESSDGSYDDKKDGSDVYYLVGLYLKDGDKVVVHNTSNAQSIAELNLGSVNLSNLTYVATKWAVVYAGTVQDCYVLGGTAGTFNGEVVNAHVYETSVFNFNGNVTNLTIEGLSPSTEHLTSSIGCTGTVYHFYAPREGRTFFDLYEIAKGRFELSNGTLMTSDVFYTRSIDYTFPVSTETPDETAASTADDDDEYDDVPKTGQSNLYLILLGVSALSLAGALAVRRTEK